MFISSGTPDGRSRHCSVCGKILVIEPSEPWSQADLADASCPQCGQLLIWAVTNPSGMSITEGNLDKRLSELDSLAAVEFVIELEDEFGRRLPEELFGQDLTLRELVGALSS
ncbi:MAG: acyl carrier protein [Pirellulales bacterium]|nr:acyl carrier protein [Pirellulales bacterium]